MSIKLCFIICMDLKVQVLTPHERSYHENFGNSFGRGLLGSCLFPVQIYEMLAMLAPHPVRWKARLFIRKDPLSMGHVQNLPVFDIN